MVLVLFLARPAKRRRAAALQDAGATIEGAELFEAGWGGGNKKRRGGLVRAVWFLGSPGVFSD